MSQPLLSRIFLFGSLTPAPPTFRQSARGTPVTTSDLRVDVRDREKACVIRVVIWGKQAKPAARQLGCGLRTMEPSKHPLERAEAPVSAYLPPNAD